MPTKFTKALLTKVAVKANELAVLKWEGIVAKGKFCPTPPDLLTLSEVLYSTCSYCALFKYCTNCPMLNNNSSCNSAAHPWQQWNWEPSKENAEKVLLRVKQVTTDNVVLSLKAKLKKSASVNKYPNNIDKLTREALSTFIKAFHIEE